MLCHLPYGNTWPPHRSVPRDFDQSSSYIESNRYCRCLRVARHSEITANRHHSGIRVGLHVTPHRPTSNTPTEDEPTEERLLYCTFFCLAHMACSHEVATERQVSYTRYSICTVSPTLVENRRIIGHTAEGGSKQYHPEVNTTVPKSRLREISQDMGDRTMRFEPYRTIRVLCTPQLHPL